MFTGIVQAKGKVTAASAEKGVRSVAVAVPRSWKLTLGESIAVDGICLTVTRRAPGSFSADMMRTTLRKTTGSAWEKGREVNLERSLKLRDLVGGHLIQGHVDARASVTGIQKEGRSLLITLKLPGVFARKAMLHGSLAVNGVSLTIASKKGNTVTLALVPYTLAHTNLGKLQKGEEVNIETDRMGRARVPGNATRRAG